MTAFSIFVLSNFLDILFYVFGHFVLSIISDDHSDKGTGAAASSFA